MAVKCILQGQQKFNLPIGGTDGQVLTKQSAIDYDAQWEDLPEGTTIEDVNEAIDNAFKENFQGYREWIAIPFPFVFSGLSITYGNGKFVAIDNSQVAYSEDGINWRKATLPSSSSNWSNVTYGNGKFVAVSGTNGKAAYSEDGLNWVETTMPSTSYWYRVTYGNGKFVAVAGYNNNDNKAAYSEDGINWTQTLMPLPASWEDITYGNGKFVAIAGGNYNHNIAAYSEDGIDWKEVAMPASVAWQSVAYGNGKFVAIAGNRNVAYSEDGISWIRTAEIPFSGHWNYITYGNDKFVSIAYDSDKATYSKDGINWIEMKMPSSNYWKEVTYGNGKFVAVSNNHNTTAYYIDSLSIGGSTSENTSGIPTGGTTGQVLAKKTNNDFDTQWVDPPQGGGTSSGVSSFNNRTGAITPQSGDYTASMVGAVPTTRTVNGKALSSNISLTASDIGALSTSGTATAATKLATARTIRTNLALTSTASFDGTASVTPGVTGILPVANGGTGSSVEKYLPLAGGTLTGNLTIKGSGNFGTKINLGDGDYVHIAEPTDDCLEIKAKKINFVTSATTDDKFTLNGSPIGGSSGIQISDVINLLNRTTAVNVANTSYGTIMARGIYAGTSDMTAGSSSLTSGVIYLVYE